MNAPRPKPIDRRSFLALLAGAAGFGATAWSFTRSGAAPPTTLPGDAALSGLPAVTTTAASIRRTPIGVDGAADPTRAVPAWSVPVLCRDAWGARPVDGGLTSHVPVRLTVHHTAAVLSSDAAAPEYVRDHQAFHQLEKGWPDIAYHFVIDATGMVYEGRPVGAVGDTSTQYDPTGHVLIACEGDFSRHGVPDAQRTALIGVLAWAASAYDIGPGTLTGHRDWVSTACPGDALYALVADGTLEAAVRDRLDDGGVGLDLRCGPAAAAVVAAIESGATVPPADRTDALSRFD